jgi:hypothetical protein
MFFLLRMAFWLGVVLVLLPSVTTQPGPAAGEVRASEAISAASATVEDLRGFCGRQPEACTVGSQMATAIGYKAQAGAKMLYDMLSESLAPHETGSLPPSPGARGGAIRTAADKAAAQKASQNTLTNDDLAPSWRGPPPRRDNPRKDGKHTA